MARHNLGYYEGRNGRVERAVKHFIVAANLGYDDSLQVLRMFYVKGDVDKEDFAAALRAHQAAGLRMKCGEPAASWSARCVRKIFRFQSVQTFYGTALCVFQPLHGHSSPTSFLHPLGFYHVIIIIIINSLSLVSILTAIRD
jgi:hypothetical protein